jgi:hypothetical protein
MGGSAEIIMERGRRPARAFVKMGAEHMHADVTGPVVSGRGDRASDGQASASASGVGGVWGRRANGRQRWQWSTFVEVSPIPSNPHARITSRAMKPEVRVDRGAGWKGEVGRAGVGHRSATPSGEYRV